MKSDYADSDPTSTTTSLCVLELLNLPVPWFLHLYNGDYDSACLGTVMRSTGEDAYIPLTYLL